MRRVLQRCALMALAVSASVMVFPSTASASLQDCENMVCGWSSHNFTGTLTKYPVGSSCEDSPFPIYSAANGYPRDTGMQIVLGVYSGPDCTGTLLAVLSAGDSQNFLSQPGLSVTTPW